MADDRVLFTLEAENAQLKAKLAESQAELANLKKAGEDAGQGVADGMGKATKAAREMTNESERGIGALTKGFRQSVAAVTSFVSSITAAVSVATTFYVLGGKIREVWKDAFTPGKEKAEEFVEALDLTKTQESLKQTEDQLTALYLKLGDPGLAFHPQLGESPVATQIKAEIARLEETRKGLRAQITSPLLRGKEAEEEARKNAMAAEKAKQDIKNSLGEAARRREETEDAIRAEEAFARIVEQVNDEYDRRMERQKELDDQSSARRIADAEKEGEAFARAAAAGMQQVIDQINRANESFFSSFADRQNGLLLSIRQEITRIRGSIPSSGGAAGFGSGGSY